MQTQKSAQTRGNGLDAKLEPTSMNSNPKVATTAPAVKLTPDERARVRQDALQALDDMEEIFTRPRRRGVAERMREHTRYYDGMNEIGRTLARQHNTADRSKGAGRPPKNEDGSRTYKMYPPIKRNRISPEDPRDLLSLLVLHLVQCASRERETGFYVVESIGPDIATVRWVEGWCDELVCQIRLTEQRALFLSSVADAHESLQRAFELADFEVFIVEGFIHATCPDCQGGGSIFAETELYDTWCMEVLACETCSGKGEV